MLDRKKQKSYTPEKIADLYLATLADEQSIFLDDFLTKNNIYHSIEILTQTLDMLRSENLVEEVEGGGFSLFTYNPVGTAFADINGEVETIPQLSITDKGRRFVEAGQELDSKGAAERKATRQKNIDKVIAAGISFITAVVTMVAKWFFFDRK